MCGIVGSVRFRPGDQRQLMEAMVARLRHRGPDDEGVSDDPEQGAALGMTRLSILDIVGGHQPMYDEAERFALVFNGEIYNYKDLWRELESIGHRFATDHSDTEVIVHGFEQWGPDVFRRLNGMFAVAIWDRVERRLTLARDRVGEKPLYLARLAGGGWAFASEIKALLVHPDVDQALDPIAIEQYLAFDFVIGPRTILRNVSKLPAGNFAVIEGSNCEVSPYWTPSFRVRHRRSEEIVEELDHLLSASVRSRMIADVPVGLFLSGGIDSSTVGYYMARESPHAHAFTIGFEDPTFDESTESTLAARHLGLAHTLHVFSQEQVAELVPQVTELLDEPMGDQSIFPTYLLSLVARKQVKVALGGDGSDELFMGYKTYQALKVAWLLDESPFGPAARWLGTHVGISGSQVRRRVARFAKSLNLVPEERLLARLGSFHGTSRWVMAGPLREYLAESAFIAAREEAQRSIRPDLPAPEKSVGAYMRFYLQEDILVKVDRASMAASLEVRSPFLDPAVIDFALSLHTSSKLHGMTRKDPLRKLMRGKIPDRIIDRPKRGFGVPLASWLRGSLAPMVNDYLAPDRIAAAGVFDPAAVASIIARHRAFDAEAGNQLWLLLQFEMWRERWLKDAARIAA
jgi:asparagine synthase (glutamine-hydrolysing)